jgi:hypothetical protein
VLDISNVVFFVRPSIRVLTNDSVFFDHDFFIFDHDFIFFNHDFIVFDNFFFGQRMIVSFFYFSANVSSVVFFLQAVGNRWKY